MITIDPPNSGSQLIDVYMKVLNPLISGECDKIQLSPPLNDEE